MLMVSMGRQVLQKFGTTVIMTLSYILSKLKKDQEKVIVLVFLKIT